MEQLKGRVAVVTGAASGIGRALAERLAGEGMQLVLADVEAPALEAARAELAAGGARVEACVTDVSDQAAVAALAERSYEAFGGVHLLCNNAGVFAGGSVWEASSADYRWVLGVNLWGVIHGLRAFVPRMIEGGEPGHIVNTASMAGFTAMPYAGPYHATKHAVVALSECLYHDLALAGADIGVSILCPEMIRTGIADSARNRSDEGARAPSQVLVEKALADGVAGGLDPMVMADRVVAAVREGRFYILAEDAWREACNQRLDEIRAGSNPVLKPPV